MLRRALALLLALSLALGATASSAVAVCAPPTSPAVAALSAPADACGPCDGAGDSGQAQQGCAALTCSLGCISGPATAADDTRRLSRLTVLDKAPLAPPDGLLARPIPPDHPPPR